MLDKNVAIKEIFDNHGPDAIYVTTTGYISRDIYNLYPDHKNIFYMQGSMGLAPSIGLGLALNSCKNVVVISGDGSLLMHLGITHTIRDCCLSNLFVYILDNGSYESVGGQSCPSLEESYNGINGIYKVKLGYKNGRVKLNCLENKKNIMEFIKK